MQRIEPIIQCATEDVRPVAGGWLSEATWWGPAACQVLSSHKFYDRAVADIEGKEPPRKGTTSSNKKERKEVLVIGIFKRIEIYISTRFLDIGGSNKRNRLCSSCCSFWRLLSNQSLTIFTTSKGFPAGTSCAKRTRRCWSRLCLVVYSINCPCCHRQISIACLHTAAFQHVPSFHMAAYSSSSISNFYSLPSGWFELNLVCYFTTNINNLNIN